MDAMYDGYTLVVAINNVAVCHCGKKIKAVRIGETDEAERHLHGRAVEKPEYVLRHDVQAKVDKGVKPTAEVVWDPEVFASDPGSPWHRECRYTFPNALHRVGSLFPGEPVDIFGWDMSQEVGLGSKFPVNGRWEHEGQWLQDIPKNYRRVTRGENHSR